MKFTPLVRGIITGIAMVIATLVLYYVKPAPGSAWHHVVRLIFAGGIVWTLLVFAKQAPSATSFTTLFGQGFRCFIVATLVMVVFTAVFSMLHPEFAEEASRYYREDLVKQGGKTPAKVDELVANMKKRYTTGIIYLTVFGYLITGIIVTVIGSALLILMRRK
jgi:hypothetical protein